MMSEDNIIEHNFKAAPLRNIWLSLIPKLERNRLYENAGAELPNNLVSTSIFALDFWTTLTKNERSVPTKDGKIEILPERAWFGIRSLLKGGLLGDEKSIFQRGDCAQLEQAKNNDHQIPRKWTSNYFSDEELILLLSIHELYEKWKKRKNMYDDLDIVKTALKYWDGTTARNRQKILPDIEENAQKVGMSLDDVIQQGMSFGNERFQFKTAFRKTYKNSTNEQQKRVLTWLKKWEKQVHKSTRVGSSKQGYTVWKQRLSHKGSEGGGRIFFSVHEDPLMNKGKVHLQIYDFTFVHDYQDKIIQKTLDLEPEPNSENWNEMNLQIDKGPARSTPGSGPTKPLPGPITIEALEHLDDSSNISLDIEQKRAIARSQPLLIDGLAGTGKTAVLSKRGAFRAGYEQNDDLEILVSSSKAHVSKRLIHDIETTIDDTEWKGINKKRKFNFTINGFERNTGSSCREVNLTNFSKSIPQSGFDEIILDECQDLTHLEFKLLSRLCIGHDPRRLTIAGDPLQTLNPTGFDWGRISAMFIDAGVDKEKVDTTEFHRNYRSQKHIVKLANAIQNHRANLFPMEKHTVMIPDRDAERLPNLLQIDTEDGNNALERVILNAEANEIAIICWAPDDASVKRLLAGDDSDDLLSKIWQKIENKDEDEHFRTKIGIHSSSSIKGAEHKNVLLYKFASNPEAHKLLQSLQTGIGQLKPAEAGQKITISFAYSMLYVAITRALDNIYFVEDKLGYEFWKKLKISEDGDANENFLKPLESSHATRFLNDLGEVNEKVRYKTFRDRIHYWETEGDITSLQTAIRLGDDLMKLGDQRVNKKDVSKLRGELCLRESKETTDRDIVRDKLLKAIALFEEAGEVHRVAPTKFENEDWGGCLTTVSNSTDRFLQFISYYCRMKIGDLESDFEGQGDSSQTIVEHLKVGLPENNPEHWTSIDLERPYNELKKKVYNYLSDNKQYEILYHEIDFFGVVNVFMALPITTEHDKLIKLFERQDYAYEFNKNLTGEISDKYTRCLVKDMENEQDYEERINWLLSRAKRQGLDESTKSKILKLCTEVRIELLEKSEKVSSPAKNVFDGKRSLHRGLKKPLHRKTTVTIQLNGFHHLYQIKLLIDEIEFVQKFGRRPLKLIQAIEDIDEEDITSAMKFLYDSRVVNKKSSGSIICEHLDWIDDETIDRLVKSLFEERTELVDHLLFSQFLQYSNVMDKSVLPLYENILKLLMGDLQPKSSEISDTDLYEIKKIFKDICEHISSKGSGAMATEMSYISEYINMAASDDTRINIDPETMRQLQESKIPFDNQTTSVLHILSFENDNKILIKENISEGIQSQSISKIEQYIELLNQSKLEVHQNKSEMIQKLIPINPDEIISELKQSETLIEFYSKLNKVIENGDGTTEEIIRLRLFIDVFNNVEGNLDDLESELGYSSWKILCKNEKRDTYDMLNELYSQINNSVNLLTVCTPILPLTCLVKKFRAGDDNLDKTYATNFINDGIDNWVKKRSGMILSRYRVGSGRAKKAMTMSEKERSQLRKLGDIEGSKFQKMFIDNMVTYLVILLNECNTNQINNILSELSIPKTGNKSEKIKKVLEDCGYGGLNEILEKIISL